MNSFQAFGSSILRSSVIYLVHHPRKGAKTQTCSYPCPNKWYHPRKGAKTPLPWSSAHSTPYHPRKGAKTYDDCTLSGTCTGTIPVRGRKLKVRFIIPVHSRTIPVRGRKPMPRPASSVPDCTIPVRGRKPYRLLHRRPCTGTIPVRGRKLEQSNEFFVACSTIPVRGQKLRVLLCVNLFELYHPRKGTKNSASKKDAEFFFCKP